MAGLNGRTRTYRLSTSKRVAKYTALVSDPTDTTGTTGALFMKIPTAKNQGPVQGVTPQLWAEPGYFDVEDTDPTTITGTTPNSPYASMLGGTGNQIGPTVQIDGQARCYIDGSGNVLDGDVVIIADAYGRVNTAANLGISGGTQIFPVGIARSKGTAANDVILVDLSFVPLVA